MSTDRMPERKLDPPEEVECPDCFGTGSDEDGDGMEIRCPTCDGTGRVEKKP